MASKNAASDLWVYTVCLDSVCKTLGTYGLNANYVCFGTYDETLAINGFIKRCFSLVLYSVGLD